MTDPVKDEWTDRINAAFPTRSGAHETYAVAMRMVGARHAKGDLVALVNWLLLERANVASDAADPIVVTIEAPREMATRSLSFDAVDTDAMSSPINDVARDATIAAFVDVIETRDVQIAAWCEEHAAAARRDAPTQRSFADEARYEGKALAWEALAKLLLGVAT